MRRKEALQAPGDRGGLVFVEDRERRREARKRVLEGQGQRPGEEECCQPRLRRRLSKPGVEGLALRSQLAHLAEQGEAAPAFLRTGERQLGESGAHGLRVRVVGVVHNPQRPAREVCAPHSPPPRSRAVGGQPLGGPLQRSAEKAGGEKRAECVGGVVRGQGWQGGAAPFPRAPPPSPRPAQRKALRVRRRGAQSKRRAASPAEPAVPDALVLVPVSAPVPAPAPAPAPAP